MTETVTAPFLTVTDRAVATITDLLAAEKSEAELGLWIEITGSENGDYTYDLAFEALGGAADGDMVFSQGALSVVVPAASMHALEGATLDLPAEHGQGGLVLRNPNRPAPEPALDSGLRADLDVTGDLAMAVAALIERDINPMLAMHGGFTQLVGVKDDKVFLMMGGGCHGCSVSWLTLRTNITRTIKTNLPQVTDVIDVTDHATGENPYFT